MMKATQLPERQTGAVTPLLDAQRASGVPDVQVRAQRPLWVAPAAEVVRLAPDDLRPLSRGVREQLEQREIGPGLSRPGGFAALIACGMFTTHAVTPVMNRRC